MSLIPTSISLSTQADLDRRLHRVLDTIVDRLIESQRREGIRSIFLGGSLSLGEGAGYRSSDGWWHLLSDIDLGLVLRSKSDESLRYRLPSQETWNELAAAEDLLLEGGVSVGFYTDAELAALPLRPELVDLSERGLIVWGERGILDSIGKDRMRDPVEGTRLLRNRAVEHLGSHPQLELSPYRLCFRIAKIYADGWTAWTWCHGDYQPGYALRLEALLEDPRGFPLANEAVSWLRWRLSSDEEKEPAFEGGAEASWRKAARDLLSVMEALPGKAGRAGGRDGPQLKFRGALENARLWRATYRYREWGGGLAFLREGLRLVSARPIDYCHFLAIRVLDELAGGRAWSDPPADAKRLIRLAPAGFESSLRAASLGGWALAVLEEWEHLA